MATPPPLKKPTPVTYSYGDPVLMALKVATARRPPLYRTAQLEFANEIVSREVNRQEWVLVGEEVLREDGSNMQEHLEQCIAQRTGEDGLCHWVEPETVIAAKSETWTGPVEGALARQGERWREIRAAFSPGKEGDAAASRLLDEEAKIFGAKVGNPTPGREPGVEKAEPAAPRLPGSDNSNPWHPQYRGSQAEKFAAMEAVIKSKGNGRLNGPALAASLAASCNVDLAGRPLRGK